MIDDRTELDARMHRADQALLRRGVPSKDDHRDIPPFRLSAADAAENMRHNVAAADALKPTAEELAGAIRASGRAGISMMLQVVPVEEALERLEEYAARKGRPPTPEDGRERGWLIRDIGFVCQELRRALAQPKPRPRRSWRDAWGLFDRRRDRRKT